MCIYQQRYKNVVRRLKAEGIVKALPLNWSKSINNGKAARNLQASTNFSVVMGENVRHHSLWCLFNCCFSLYSFGVCACVCVLVLDFGFCLFFVLQFGLILLFLALPVIIKTFN